MKIWTAAKRPPEDDFHINRSSKVQIFLSIDDTDNNDSPGSGQLADILADNLQQCALASNCSNVSRHQLFVHDDIPYTSHNSSMCFTAIIGDNTLEEVIQFSRRFLTESAATGSDPGLCVAPNDESLNRDLLVEFGLRAKDTILTKDDAYQLAGKVGIHLSENGGTGDGIVGALAGTGLRIHGSDGRVRGWLNLGDAGSTTSTKDLCEHPSIDGVVDNCGRLLSDHIQIRLGDNKVKTVLQNHKQVIPVIKTDVQDGPGWKTLSRKEIKRF